MFIINKKRISFILIIFILSIVSLVTNLNLENSVQTVALPISTKTIILDAGHGLPDGGATNSFGLYESDINLQITTKLQALLEASDCSVILTRSDENGIYDANAKKKKVSDLNNRIKIINNSNADLLVSIHLNKISQSKYYGWQTFYQKNNNDSKRLATSIQNSLNYYIDKNNKRTVLPISNIFLMENSKIPSVIVECGFLSNHKEASLLQTEEYQNMLSWGIYIGIMEYFK